MAPEFFNFPAASGVVGSAYNFTWDIISDTPVNTEVITGALPSGLTLSDNTENNHPVISGTPDTAGEYAFTMIAVGEGTTTIDITMTIVNPSPPFTWPIYS